MTFTPGADDAEFTFRINTDSQTPGLRVDDVKLEAGEEATPSWEDDGRFRIEPRGDEEQVRIDGGSSGPAIRLAPLEIRLVLLE